MNHLSHQQAQSCLHQGNLLGPEIKQALEEHLSGCSACRDYAAILERLAKREWDPYAEQALSAQEKARLYQDLHARLGQERGGQRPLFSWAAWVVFATLLILAVGWVIGNTLPGLGQRSSATGLPEPAGLPGAIETEAPPVGVDSQPDQLEGIRHIGSIELFGQAPQSVTVQGDYAYVGLPNRLLVLDISKTNQPQVTGRAVFSSENQAPVLDVYVHDGLAYVANWFGGLQIIDVSDPSRPLEFAQVFAEWEGQPPKVTLHHVKEVAGVSGQVAYVVIISCESPCRDMDQRPSLRAVDIFDPSHPRLLGAWQSDSFEITASLSENRAYVGDQAGMLSILDLGDGSHLEAVGALDAGWPISEIAIQKQVAFLLAGNRLVNVDVSNPAAPALLGKLMLPASSRYHLAVSGEYAYLGDSSSVIRRLWVVDISDLASPRLVESFEEQVPAAVGQENVYHGMAVQGNLIFLAGSSKQVDIYQFNPPGMEASSLAPGDSSLPKDTMVSESLSILELQENADFPLLFPSEVPAGFTFDRVEGSEAFVTLYYSGGGSREASRKFLTISQSMVAEPGGPLTSQRDYPAGTETVAVKVGINQGIYWRGGYYGGPGGRFDPQAPVERLRWKQGGVIYQVEAVNAGLGAEGLASIAKALRPSP